MKRVKPEDILDAVGMVDDELIRQAREVKRKPFFKRKAFLPALAAVLVLSLSLGLFFGRGRLLLHAYAIAEAEYPTMSPYPEENSLSYSKKREAWRNSKEAQLSGYDEGMAANGFFAESIREFLSEKPGENRAYSPVNVYMALSMLAELTEGTSRAQILELLGISDIGTLRENASAVWNACYCDDGRMTSVLANSLWLNQDIRFHKEPLETLAETYYASSYCGKMGSGSFDRALREWLDQQTGGMLRDSIDGLYLDKPTLLSLVSTVFFEAEWGNGFLKNRTEQGIFYTPAGEVSCDFMSQKEDDTYYWGEGFSAVKKWLKGGCQMWFILPDEGVTPEELLSEPQAMEFLLSNGVWENKKDLSVRLVVPKFDISSETDLIEGLKKLGVTEVFDGRTADFSPLMTGEGRISKAQHAVRVQIDEKGCSAAAYLKLDLTKDGPPLKDNIDFIVNRPFLFVITSEVELPLFAGIVNTP